MKKLILIVDDEEGMLNSMRRDLRELNGALEIHTASSAREALKMIEKLEIELLIVDIFMPDKDGLELIRETREKFPSIKIIAMSAFGIRWGVNYLEIAKKFGAHYTLNKPFSRDELRSAIHHVLQNNM